jgi:transposase
MHKRHDAGFKALVALEAIREDRSLAELPAAYGFHPVQIGKRNEQVLDESPGIFSGRSEKKDAAV